MSEGVESRRDAAALPLAVLIEGLRSHPTEARSSEAAVEILRRFHPLLRKYWRWHKLGDYEDFLQEVMVRLFTALPHLRDPDAFPGLLRRIVIGVSADALRGRRPQEEDISDIDTDQLAGEFDETLATPVVVRSYLELLPPREQEVLYLTYFEDLDSQEVSARLGLSSGAVRMTKSRAISRLRELLAVRTKKHGSS